MSLDTWFSLGTSPFSYTLISSHLPSGLWRWLGGLGGLVGDEHMGDSLVDNMG